MRDRLRFYGFSTLPSVLLVLILSSLQPLLAFAEGDTVFQMREVSVFDTANASDLSRGQHAQCETKPNSKVTAYPELKSKKPLYGVIKFNRDYLDPQAGVEYHFVIDESGGTPPAESPSLLGTLSRALGNTDNTAVQTHNTYDLLYFDKNRDLDLTNDPIVRAAANPPSAAVPSWSATQKVVFDDLSVPFDFGQDVGMQSVAILPKLVISEHEGVEYPAAYFVAKKARQGRIRIGSREYDAVLGQQYVITGRLDVPSTGLLLRPVNAPNNREWWWGADQLNAMRFVDGQYYTTTTTALGDKLTVSPYQGEYGLLRMDAGGRQLDKVSVSGSLRTKETSLAIGDMVAGSSSPEAVREFKLPVGDYMASFLNFEFGPLRIGVSDNYHSDGKPMDMERTRVQGIKIRADKPFVLDFGNDPEVMFASPAKEQTYHPGDDVGVKAVLTDPVLDIMFRDLDDTSRKQKDETELPDGRTRTIERTLSLDPMVTITDSRGKVVSKGKMPFG